MQEKEKLNKIMQEAQIRLAKLEQEEAKTKAIEEAAIKSTTPIQDQYITKAAAAIEVRKQAKIAFTSCIAGIVFIFVVGLSTIFNQYAGLVVGVIGAGVLGYFAVNSNKKSLYLTSTYKL